jgi:hypothetical protein
MKGRSLLVLLLGLAACRSAQPTAPASAYREVSEVDRETTEAERLSRQGADLAQLPQFAEPR